MTPAATIELAGPWGSAVLAIAVLVAVVVAVWYWRSSAVRDTWLRATLVALRVAVVLGLGLALADPAVTREARRLPSLRVVWDLGARFEVADAPGGTTRRDELEKAVAAARDLGLGDRFDFVDAEASESDATLLLTDSGAGPASLDGLEMRGGRVVAIAPVADPGVPDLAVVAVAAPPRGASGAPRSLSATLRCSRAAGRRAVVTVSDGARVLASASLDVGHDDELASIDLAFVPQAEGWQRLTVEVAGLTGEVEVANNRMDCWIAAEPRVRRVLFVESQPTWEGKFVRRALEEDPAFGVDYVARTSKAAGVALAPEGEPAPPSTPAVRTMFADAARLFEYDAIVLGALDASELGEADLSRLAAFVDSRGGGLVVLGGNAYGGSILSSRGVLADLLPAAVPASSLGATDRTRDKRTGAAALRPAPGLERHPVFAALGEQPAAVLERLQQLGGDYLRLGPLKPGASAIAVDAGAPGETKPALVAVQQYGAGRVAIVAPQDTWRLAVGAPDDAASAAARVWTSLVGWVGANALDPVALDVDAGSVAAGEPIRVDLLVRSTAFVAARSARVAATAVRDDDSERVPVEMRPDAESPGVFFADVVLPKQGTWRVEAEVNGRERATVEIVAREPDPATERSRPDPIRFERFRSAVARTGGDVFASDAVDALVASTGGEAPRMAVETSHPARHPLWGLAILLLAIAEMFLRRWYSID